MPVTIAIDNQHIQERTLTVILLFALDFPKGIPAVMLRLQSSATASVAVSSVKYSSTTAGLGAGTDCSRSRPHTVKVPAPKPELVGGMDAWDAVT